MSRDEIIERFTIERINDSPATFDSEKLEWMNGVYIRDMDTERLMDLLIPFMECAESEGGMPDSVKRPIDRNYLRELIPLVHERLKLLTEGTEMLDFFFSDKVEPAAKDIPGRKMDVDLTIDALAAALKLCRTVSPFEPDQLETAYRSLAEEMGLKPGQLFSPIRVTTTGKTFAPPLFDTMAAIGRARCITRMERGLEILKSTQ